MVKIDKVPQCIYAITLKAGNVVKIFVKDVESYEYVKILGTKKKRDLVVATYEFEGKKKECKFGCLEAVYVY